MKSIYSALAEKQTIGTERINERVSIRIRKVVHGTEHAEIVKDIMVDGYVYTAAVGVSLLAEFVSRITEIVSQKCDYVHLGHGQWLSHSEHAQ